MSDTEKNIRVSQIDFGNAKQSLKLESVPLDILDEGLIRVRVEAANINPSDLLSIRGIGQYRHNHQTPRVPGFEAVGTVVESNHTKFMLGQRVLVAASGTWQKYIDVLPENLFHIPLSLKSGYACQLYINALTAWVLTTEITQLTKEDVVIINAGSSAIGKIFAQLSSSLGFRLIVVTSKPKDYPYSVTHVLDAKINLATQIQRIDAPKPNVAFDAIGGKVGSQLSKTVCKLGRFINYGTLSLEFYEPNFFDFIKNQDIKFNTFFLRHWENAVGSISRREKFMLMLEHFIENQIQLDVDRFVPLHEVLSAIDLIEDESKVLSGKVVLTIK
ncbi:zinc-dependent alcohol dehydrogenase family protein [Vibrio mediterranei]|uniref:zinc-dependent alcohol dehydrogenase family protein n=1 Tax=Vibrio mediterranei TaxID=689 RepID=UPI00148E66B9|nr:zinc-dependent alcohol dehydrogenase family protein [Vibrio mediterranei]NOH31721.1 zinc-dependent alcohol dehydrogenase family protein [Vibrio mediterranei]